MAPSSMLQARIKQFEAMNSRPPNVEGSQYPPMHVFPVAPSMTGASSNSSNSSPDLLGEPVSPTAASYTIIKPTIQVPYVARKPRKKSPSPSPPNLGLKSSLIDLKEWIVEDNPNGRARGGLPTNFVSQSNAYAPPALPPRKVSQASSRSDSSSSSHSPAPRPPKRRSSNTLTVEHTYPPLSRNASLSNLRQQQGHVPASSTSSFQSVSLSSDGGDGPFTPGTKQTTFESNGHELTSFDRKVRELDTASLDDALSFETASSASLSTSLSSTQEWDFMSSTIKQEPPKLPARKPMAPLDSSSPPLSLPSRNSSSTSFSINPSSARRAPPPVPTRQKSFPSSATHTSSLKSASTSTSDRSSISSASTAATGISTHIQLLRPTPIPAVARKRYDALFFANVNAQRRISKQPLGSGPNRLTPSPPGGRKGWRGLSVDLIVHPEDQPGVPGDDVPPGDGGVMKLDREVVKVIWSKSTLEPAKLKCIWLECALSDQDGLDQEGFSKGMWRIDEELRRLRSFSKHTSPAFAVPRSRPARATISSLLH